MYGLDKDTDSILNEFINEYVEEKLDPVESEAFEECMADDAGLASFVKRSREGRRLARNAYRVMAAEDFESRLAERIARENEGKDLDKIPY